MFAARLLLVGWMTIDDVIVGDPFSVPMVDGIVRPGADRCLSVVRRIRANRLEAGLGKTAGCWRAKVGDMQRDAGSRLPSASKKFVHELGNN